MDTRTEMVNRLIDLTHIKKDKCNDPEACQKCEAVKWLREDLGLECSCNIDHNYVMLRHMEIAQDLLRLGNNVLLEALESAIFISYEHFKALKLHKPSWDEYSYWLNKVLGLCKRKGLSLYHFDRKIVVTAYELQKEAGLWFCDEYDDYKKNYKGGLTNKPTSVIV